MSTQEYVGAGSGLRLQQPVGAFPRAGAWAVWEGRRGVLAAVDAATAELHLVDEQGDTTLISRGVPLDALRQATFAEIPARRRPAESVARKLGYLPAAATGVEPPESVTIVAPIAPGAAPGCGAGLELPPDPAESVPPSLLRRAINVFTRR